MKKPEQLIDDIIRFIDNERELYGDFIVAEDKSTKPKGIDESRGDEGKPENEVPAGNDKSISEPSSASYQEFEQEDNNRGSESIYDRIDNCNTLEELEELCQAADILKTDLKDTQLVFGVGNPDADLMLIGEAPGAEEDRQGEPFVGKAGQLLNDILAAINFKRKDVYIANILKHRPPNNRNPKPAERKRSLPFLLRQIDLVDPKLILSLGKVSAQTLLKKNTSLSKMRGQFHPFRDKYELLATYHPAALLRHPKWKRPTWKDVQKLRKRYDELKGQP